MLPVTCYRALPSPLILSEKVLLEGCQAKKCYQVGVSGYEIVESSLERRKRKKKKEKRRKKKEMSARILSSCLYIDTSSPLESTAESVYPVLHCKNFPFHSLKTKTWGPRQRFHVPLDNLCTCDLAWSRQWHIFIVTIVILFNILSYDCWACDING